MIAIKLLGSLLILSAGALAGIGCVRHDKKKLNVLEAWIELLSLIRGQIDLYLMPIEDILSRADRSLLARLGNRASPHTLQELLASSRADLDEETIRRLSLWIKECGGSYRDEALKRCDDMLEALQKQREILFSALPARIKLTLALPLCLSLGTAILLW